MVLKVELTENEFDDLWQAWLHDTDPMDSQFKNVLSKVLQAGQVERGVLASWDSPKLREWCEVLIEKNLANQPINNETVKALMRSMYFNGFADGKDYERTTK